MKRKALFAVLGMLAFAAIAFVIWGVIRTPVSESSQMVRFIGLTNGVVGSNVVEFGSLSTNHAAFIERWLSAGSNAAVFIITNRQDCTIKVVTCWFQTRQGHLTNEQTLALNSRVTYGFHVLQPGQEVTSHVAVIPHLGPWRVAFSYNRHDWREKLRISGAALRGTPPVQLQSHVFQSDWIGQ